ncbi:CaiB/BaiF CoA transferase family protein [Thalassomonas sp. M1454]|uniref:CaiB/BaiF CoA transferase family protein n=1 Tax=Thalassomonas sp. M1454 TaxID=2594477 RepID=UPI0011813E45|nr:CoA transferase [Thalassomonas sp. M1454]TRX55070.1 CoA transferase [Thalassomonas sp. M1454]
MSELPLKGVRIIAVEQYGAGPFASMYLADLGAEVIKIENPKIGGDISRHTGPYFLGKNDSYFFQTFNSNKKSFTLNLKSEQGQEVFAKLVASSDAVLNNLRGDQPDKLGLTYQALKAVNPKIVCAHLSAYGRDNDRATWPGYDYLMQAEAGFMHLTGEPGSPPARFGLSMVDFMTGVTTSLGLTAALFGALKTGVGRDVDVSLFDVALHQLTYPATWYLNEDHVTERAPRSAHPSTVPCQLFKTSDGWIFIMAMTEKFWQALVDEIDDQQLRAEQFATVALRRDCRDQLTEILDGLLSKQTTAQWLERLNGKLPVAPVYDLPQALNNPYLRETGAIQKVPHSQNPDMEVVANPIRLNGQRLQSKACVTLGENTEELLADVGFNQDEIKELQQQSVV